MVTSFTFKHFKTKIMANNNIPNSQVLPVKDNIGDLEKPGSVAVNDNTLMFKAENGSVVTLTGTGGTGEPTATQAYVDSKIALLQGLIDQANTNLTATNSNITTNFKRKDQFIDVTASVDFPALAPLTMSAAVTVSNSSTSGISGGDRIALGISTNRNSNLIIYAIAGTNLISFYAYNTHASTTIDNVNGTYKVTVIKAGDFS